MKKQLLQVAKHLPVGWPDCITPFMLNLASRYVAFFASA
jgi:hypothetical protein